MKILKNQKGFTLIEVMTALVIVLVLIIAFSGAILSSFKAELRMDDRMEAVRFSDSIIEQLKTEELSDADFDINVFINDKISNNDFIDEKVTNDDINGKLTTTDNLHLIKIVWEDRNYKIEALLAGD